ncbi:uncharacterized protein LOC120447470 isoform X5 [Drosophila santomea]|uniref:uncharacterized protein LOC120447470 isoform X5 n=1 Tax=Drosophila santomea TaxID=129105 RepID=UPI001954380A|nr:uncharacterized protein LOC120447470 isoform X5 [Drosophila santomea]
METIGADDYTAAELRNWCEKLSMQKSGNKATLAARLNGVPPEARGVCPVIGELEGEIANNDLEHEIVGESAPEVDMESPRSMIEDAAAGVVPPSSEHCTNAESMNVHDDARPSTSTNHRDSELAREEHFPEVSTQFDAMQRQLRLLQLENEMLKLESARRHNAATSDQNSAATSDQNSAATSGHNKATPLIRSSVAKPNQHKDATQDQEVAGGDARSEEAFVNKQTLLAMAKEMIPIFDGASNNKLNVSTWVAQLNAVSKMFKLSDDVIRMLVMSKLKDHAQIWLHSSERLLTLPVQELLFQLGEVFHGKESKIISRRKFQERKWKPSEDFSTYFKEKTLLATQIRIDDEELIDNIIEGIPDSLLRQQAHMHCFNSSAQMLHAFAKVSLRKPLLSPAGRVKVSFDKEPGSAPPKRCFNCNAVGHFAADCRKPKREYGACYACGSKDHLVYNCTERKFVSDNEYNA